MFSDLEEIKTYCDQHFTNIPPQTVDETTISTTQVPSSRTYTLRMTILPPLTGTERLDELNQLKARIEQSGFQARIRKGPITGTGYLLQLSATEPTAVYAVGEEVGFRADPAGPPMRFRVKSCKWNARTKESEYHITPVGGGTDFTTVSESELSRVGRAQ